MQQQIPFGNDNKKGRNNDKGRGKGKDKGKGKGNCKGKDKGKGNCKCNSRFPSGMTTKKAKAAATGQLDWSRRAATRGQALRRARKRSMNLVSKLPVRKSSSAKISWWSGMEVSMPWTMN